MGGGLQGLLALAQSALGVSRAFTHCIVTVWPFKDGQYRALLLFKELGRFFNLGSTVSLLMMNAALPGVACDLAGGDFVRVY